VSSAASISEDDLKAIVTEAVIEALDAPQSATLQFWGTKSQCAYISSALLSYCFLHGIAADVVPTGGGWVRKHYLLRATMKPSQAAELQECFESLLAQFH
jgi:hypothetical protein